MHILAGKYKGHKLLADEEKTRPTTGKTKQALCSILQGRIAETKVLDLFCGSGAVGFELLSSGARELVGIDKDIRMVLKNANSLKANCRFYKNDCLRAISRISAEGEKFDIIFLDPPYDYKNKDDLLLAISNFDILAKEGIIIFETNKETSFSEILGRLKVVKEYKYGYSKLTMFKCLTV